VTLGDKAGVLSATFHHSKISRALDMANMFDICVKNQQMHQLCIKFINYVW
jgi:hypothetical protein